MAIYVGCNATRIYWKPHFSQILKADLDDLNSPHKSVLIWYVDVLLLCSKCLTKSPQDTLYLLQKLTLKGHKVSKEKLQFCKTGVKYLGHRVVTEGQKSRWNQGGSWNAGTEKPDPYRPSLPSAITIMKEYNPSPRPPHREKVSALLFPDPVYMPPPISKWPARPLSHSLYPGYKSGLRTLFNVVLPWAGLLFSEHLPLINLISVSFCLMSGNSFPTCTWTTTCYSVSVL